MMMSMKKYITNSIITIFPYSKVTSSNRAIIKIDIGPFRTNIELLAKLWNLGFLLYPVVPNTTSI